MKLLLMALAVIALIPIPIFGQQKNRPEIGVIKDTDGYTNIRSAPQTNSKVLGRLNRNDFVYFIRSDNSWWKLTTRYGEGVSTDPPPPPEQNGYIHSSRVVPIKDLSISQIETVYGHDWTKEKKELSFGNMRITILNAQRMNYSGANQIPELNSAYLEIRIPGLTPIRKYYPDIEGVGGAADVRYVPVPSIPDLRFFVKNGDYDGRTIIITKDGRVVDLDGGGFLLFQDFLISQTGADCCGEPLVWNLKVWKEVYDLRNDTSIDTGTNPQYSYFIAQGNLYLKMETLYDPYVDKTTSLFFRFNKEGKFIRDSAPPSMEKEMRLLPEDLWH